MPDQESSLNLGYIELSKIHPGQVRYSSRNVEAKISKAVKNGHVTKTEKGYLPSYDEGRSLLPLTSALPVVLSPDGYILIDGHHATLLSLHFDAKTIPIKQIGDYSQISLDAFWEKAEQLGLAHLKNLSGEKNTPPRSFSDLQDDAGRYFAALTARKYSADFSTSTGAEYPLWIKVDKDIPFVEFYISDALLARDVIYEYSMGEEPSEEFIEKARAALLEAEVPGLKVVSKRVHFKEIDIDEISLSLDVVCKQ